MGTKTQDREDQQLWNLPENADEKENAPTPVLSDRARMLVVPKAAARPPVGLLQRMAKRREGMRVVEGEGISSSQAEGGFSTEATDFPCCANQIPTETASPAKGATATMATDSPVAIAPSTQASMQLLESLTTMNLVKEN